MDPKRWDQARFAIQESTEDHVNDGEGHDRNEWQLLGCACLGPAGPWQANTVRMTRSCVRVCVCVCSLFARPCH